MYVKKQNNERSYEKISRKINSERKIQELAYTVSISSLIYVYVAFGIFTNLPSQD